MFVWLELTIDAKRKPVDVYVLDGQNWQICENITIDAYIFVSYELRYEKKFEYGGKSTWWQRESCYS